MNYAAAFPHPESPRLSAIDKPKSFVMKVAYWMSRRMFGTVISPMRYLYSRSSAAFWVSIRIWRSEKKVRLPEATMRMIQYYTSHLNDCPFCEDISQAMSEKAGLELAEWTEYLHFEGSDRFSPKEKSLLAYLEAVNTTLTASDEVFAELKRHWTDEEIVEITWVNAVENYYNLMARPLGLQSDGLVDGMRKR